MEKKKLTPKEELQLLYEEIIFEAETFYVTKFITSETINEEYKNTIDCIFNVTGTVEPGKGLIAYNPKYGQGKTFIFDLINHRFRRQYGRYLFIKTSAKELCNLYKKHGVSELDKFIRCKNLFIDDIGDEDEKVVKHYGDELNVIRYVILKRYEFWTNVKRGWLTFGTTNLDKKQLAAEYGGRPADRLAQMVHWRNFSFLGEGKSFRQFEGTRKLSKQEIRENWKPFLPKPKEDQKVTTRDYVNGLFEDSDEYLEVNDFSRWTIVKNFLVEKGLLNLENIPMEILETAGTLARIEQRRTSDQRLKHAGTAMQVSANLKSSVTKTDTIYIAGALMAKKVFMKLREKNHRFE